MSKEMVSVARLLLRAQASIHEPCKLQTTKVMPAPNAFGVPTAPIIQPGDVQCSIVELGRGAYGVVHKGRFQSKDVAVKTVLNSTGAEALEAEMDILSRLDSPYIVPMLARSPPDAPKPQLLLELMDGGSLCDYLALKSQDKSTPMELNLISAAVSIAHALVHVHSRGLVHRDLKSHNVLLSTSGAVKVADFGIARGVAIETMTQGAGTLSWTAPEVLDGQRYGQAADVYSFGVILTELDTLQEPYRALNLGQWAITDGVRSGALRPSLRPECPDWYQQLTQRCLAQDPLSRPTAFELVEELEAHMSSS